MKKSANSNMYTVGQDAVWERCEAHLSGARDALVCAVSTDPLSDRARRALTSSVAALGYGEGSCAFLWIGSGGQSSGERSEAGPLATESAPRLSDERTRAACDSTQGAHDTDASQPLADRALFAALEGLDPLAVIVTDRAAISALAHAYRTPALKPGTARLLGRETVLFDGFESMLESEDGRQRAWAMLKRLPRIES